MKVEIVGSGFVGGTSAGYGLDMQGVGREVILVDKNDAARKRGACHQPSTIYLPRREVPDSYLYEKRWGFLWRRPTVNTRMRRILD